MINYKGTQTNEVIENNGKIYTSSVGFDLVRQLYICTESFPARIVKKGFWYVGGKYKHAVYEIAYSRLTGDLFIYLYPKNYPNQAGPPIQIRGGKFITGHALSTYEIDKEDAAGLITEAIIQLHNFNQRENNEFYSGDIMILKSYLTTNQVDILEIDLNKGRK